MGHPLKTMELKSFPSNSRWSLLELPDPLKGDGKGNSILK